MKEKLAEIFRTKSRAEWTAIFEDVDACVTPVLSLEEAADHPHNRARNTYAVGDVMQPAPAPRFSRTPGSIRNAPPVPGQDTRDALQDWGFEESETARLQEIGAVA